MQNTTNDWGYYTEKSNDACLAMKKGCYWPRGKLLGGSSALNAMLYVRGNRRDYDHWAELGNPSWDWDSVLEYFKKSEDNQVDYLIANDKYHSVGGPLKVDNFNSGMIMKTLLADAFSALGYERILDVNSNQHIGTTKAPVTAHKGARWSSAKAFLLPAMSRPNLQIIKNAHVTSLEYHEDGSVKGVKFSIKESVQQIAKVRKEVVLSAGAVNTPQILMQSGIGPKDLLENLKVKVVKDLPVGKNLQDHVFIPYFLSFSKSNPTEVSSGDAIRMAFDYALNRSGLMSHHGSVDFMGFFNTKKDSEYPDIQFHTTYAYKNEPVLALLMKQYGYDEEITESVVAVNRQTEVVMFMITLLNPKSVGKIELRSTNPFDPPKIYHNYLTDQEDVDTILRSIRIFRSLSTTQMYKTNEGQDLTPKIRLCDKLEYDSDAYWKCYIRHMSTTMFHPTGTAKMGSDSDEEAVVDSVLRVRGVKGLRVADASIMPKVVSGNTNAPTIMIGEKAADFIKEEYLK